MAQAARQNLRMQKELKLLLTDPPPGVSLSDSSSSSSTSLTNLNVEMKGPEGSVYADGVFHIKIQIPDRYPFQPPNLTFATPIYHPNIDTGGRICLDILNLPPKGAWQPSLNISTVLMSIGLLLSEPNPDDGLMCEASREYKYNRQTFDQKARSMTEKYAKAGVSIGSGSTPAKPSPLMAEMKEHSIKPKTFTDEYVDCKRPGRVSRKLSLESSTTSQKRENIADGNNSSSSHSQTVAPNTAAAFPRQDVDIHNGQTPHQDDTSKAGSDLCPGKLSGRPLKSSASLQIMPNHDKENPMQRDDKVDSDNGDVNQTQKKVLGIRRKLSLHSSVSKSENISGSAKSSLLPLNEIGSAINMTKSKLKISKKLPLGTSTCFKWEDDGNKENVPPNCLLISGNPTTNVDVLPVEAGLDAVSTKEADNSEAVIVLDSEDSEEEVRRPSRSRLSIARKPLVGKRKAKA